MEAEPRQRYRRAFFSTSSFHNRVSAQSSDSNEVKAPYSGVINDLLLDAAVGEYPLTARIFLKIKKNN